MVLEVIYVYKGPIGPFLHLLFLAGFATAASITTTIVAAG